MEGVGQIVGNPHNSPPEGIGKECGIAHFNPLLDPPLRALRPPLIAMAPCRPADRPARASSAAARNGLSRRRAGAKAAHLQKPRVGLSLDCCEGGLDRQVCSPPDTGGGVAAAWRRRRGPAGPLHAAWAGRFGVWSSPRARRGLFGVAAVAVQPAVPLHSYRALPRPAVGRQPRAQGFLVTRRGARHHADAAARRCHHVTPGCRRDPPCSAWCAPAPRAPQEYP